MNSFELAFGPNRARRFPAWPSTLLALTLTLVVSACGGSSSSDDDDLPGDIGQDGRVAQMRFINVIPDSPIIEMFHEGRSSTAFTELLNYGQGSNRNDFVIGDFRFNFSYVNGAGTRVTLYEESDFALRDGNELNYIMTGTLNNAQLIRLDNPEFLVGLDDATADVDPQIQFMHTAVGIGAIDFYLTENGTDIAAATPLATLAFGENSEIFDTVATNTAQLRAYEAGSTANLLFDSGATPIARTTRSLVLATNYFGPVAAGDSAVELRRFGRTPLSLGNANQPTTFRVHNVIADQNAVDVYLGDVAGTPEFAGVDFGLRTDELQLSAGPTDITVTSAGNPADVLQTITARALLGGTRTTLYLGGEASDPDNNNAANIGSSIALESNRRIAEGVSLRVFNGASSTNRLDVYLLRPGQDINNSSANNLGMGDYVGISVVSGDFDIVIVDTTNQGTIFGPERVSPTLGTALNVVIRDTFGGTTPVQVDLIEDPAQGL